MVYCHIALFCCVQKQKNLQSEIDHLKAKCLDVERADRITRVDLEQLSKRVSEQINN